MIYARINGPPSAVERKAHAVQREAFLRLVTVEDSRTGYVMLLHGDAPARRFQRYRYASR
jgi:hypothetical protein